MAFPGGDEVALVQEQPEGLGGEAGDRAWRQVLAACAGLGPRSMWLLSGHERPLRIVFWLVLHSSPKWHVAH